MDLIGALDVGDLAAAFARLPVFPVFDLGYFVVSLLYLKYEKGKLGGEPDSPLRPSLRQGRRLFFSRLGNPFSGGAKFSHLFFLPTDLLRRVFFIELLLALMIKWCSLVAIPSIVLVMSTEKTSLAPALVPCLHPHIPPPPLLNPAEGILPLQVDLTSKMDLLKMSGWVVILAQKLPPPSDENILGQGPEVQLPSVSAQQ